jgi:hypothetical protein
MEKRLDERYFQMSDWKTRALKAESELSALKKDARFIAQMLDDCLQEWDTDEETREVIRRVLYVTHEN